MLNKALKWLLNVLILFLLVIVATSSYSMVSARLNPGAVPSIAGFRLMSVLSGSMRPALQPGDMILSMAVKPEEIKIGDIITYGIGREYLVTHRVADIDNSTGELRFKAKGDANNAEDNRLIAPEQILGRHVLRIPYGGYIGRFARSPLGLAMLIGIPAMTILLGELKRYGEGVAEKKREKLKSKV